MASFIIEGGRPLSGEIVPQGAKNEALQVISATLLTSREVTIDNVPEISDVKNLIGLLGMLGVEITRHRRGLYTFCARNIDAGYAMSEDFVKRCARLRGSVLVVARCWAAWGRHISPNREATKSGAAKSTPISRVS